MPAPNARRPSISSTMLWLSRKDSRSPAEPISHGAVVVRTPEDALRDTNVRVIYQASNLPSQPSSPPLPPLPLSEPGDSDRELPDKTPRRAHKHQRPPSPTPSASSLRPSLKSRSSTAVEDPPVVPPLPPNIPLSAPVAPFAPVLLSPLPLPEVDPSKTIVVLETATATYKSTLATLSSRPSYLADYLAALPRQRYSHASSVYSTESSDDAAQYNHSELHAVAQTQSTTLHIFLDRPSAPYAHILAFLRTPSVAPEYPCALPRGIQLSSLSNSTSATLFNTKLEALLEVRDETAYLGLDSLQKLCNEEIRLRFALAPRHTRGTSHASVNTMMSPGLLPVINGVHGLRASVHSLHTLTEHVKGDGNSSPKGAPARVSGSSDSADDEGTDSLPVSASPSPVPSPNPSYTASRYHKDNHISVQSISKVKPPHSASSSPGQTFTRPKLHKKSESAIVVPTRPPMMPNLSRRSETKTGGRVTGHHTSSSVVGTGAAPPGWI